MGSYDTEPTERHEELYMSPNEAETKTVTGICAEISERGDWTTFHIDSGGKYPVKLATKLQPLVELGRAVRAELATWTYTERASDKINEHTGQPFVNRYLESVTVAGAGGTYQGTPEELAQIQKVVSSVATPDAAPQARPPVLGGDKDRLIVRQVCVKAAAELYSSGGQDWGDDPPLAVMKAAQRFETWIYRDIADVPFDERPDLSEHDQGIPF